MYVTHKAMKLTVTLGRPACDVARKMTNGAKQIQPSTAGRVENRHEDLRGDWL